MPYRKSAQIKITAAFLSDITPVSLNMNLFANPILSKQQPCWCWAEMGTLFDFWYFYMIKTQTVKNWFEYFAQRLQKNLI